MKTSVIRNQRGILTLDLIFGLSLTLGAMIIVFALSLTFSSIEVAQYIAFSTSRAFYAGHVSKEKQEALAESKFNELKELPTTKNFFRSGWFELKYLGAQDYKEEYEDVMIGSHSPMSGVEVQIRAKLLAFNVPFFGRTADSENGLQTKVNSYLGREPSAEECIEMTAQRWKKIKQNMDLSGFNFGDNDYAVITDDGC